MTSIAARLGCVSLLLALAACATRTEDLSQPIEQRLAHQLRGSGPVVVFQSGLGDGASVWGAVTGSLPPGMSSLAYDRPGYGDSARSLQPRDPCSVAKEQHALLLALGLKPPYLLVGHSLGGLYEYAYARLYPQEVSGLLLLDPTHPTHWQRLQQEAPGAATLVRGVRATLFSDTERREFDQQADCLSTLDSSRPLGVPVRIMVSTVFTSAEQGAYERMLQKLRPDWLRLTGATALEPVAGAGHYLQKDQPAVVRRAIEQMLTAQAPAS